MTLSSTANYEPVGGRAFPLNLFLPLALSLSSLPHLHNTTEYTGLVVPKESRLRFRPAPLALGSPLISPQFHSPLFILSSSVSSRRSRSPSSVLYH
jgi:hypothetical protein